MKEILTNSLEDIAPYVVEHLLPEIHESVEACVESFKADPYNDSWTFGTQLWRNTWNRFSSVAGIDDCPFDIHGKGNEYKLKIGSFILRHHKINDETKLPTGAKAVKEAASAVQTSIFSFLGETPIERPAIDNIVIAINATTKNGLVEVFLGELVPTAPDSKKFKWANKQPIYLANGQVPSSEEYLYMPSLPAIANAPVEKLSEPTLTLNKTVSQPQKKQSMNGSDK